MNLVIEEKIVKLRDDLKLKHPDSFMDIRILQDVHASHNLVSGPAEDEIAWKSMRAQFDDNIYGLNLTKGMKEDCGVKCEDEFKRGFIEKLFNFSKCQIKKIINIQRVKSHGKLLNATSSHNKVPKKTNPNEMNSRKRTKRKFEPGDSVHFKN